MRAIRSALAVTILAATTWTGTAAAQPTSTSTLTPTPPPGYTCNTVGRGTICHAVFDIAVGPEITDVPCPGFDVYDTAAGREDSTLYYNADGDGTRKENHDLYSYGQWSNPLTGDVVDYSQNNVFSYVLAAPGDFTSSILTVAGEIVVRDTTSTPVLIGAGRQVFNFDESELISTTGRNDIIAGLYGGDTTAFDKVCAALSK